MSEQQDKQRAIETIGREGFAPFPTDANRFGRRSPKHPGAFLTPNVDEVRLPYSELIDPGTYMVKLHVSAAELPTFLNPITKEQIAKAVRDGAEAEYRADDEEFNIPRLVERVKAILFPEEAPTDANPTGGAHA